MRAIVFDLSVQGVIPLEHPEDSLGFVVGLFQVEVVHKDEIGVVSNLRSALTNSHADSNYCDRR